METFSENDNTADIEKGIGIQNQLRIWDSLLEIRINFQKVLSESNELPRLERFEDFSKNDVAKEAEGKRYMAAVQSFRHATKDLMGDLLELQTRMSSFNNSDKDDSLQDGMDEEITSEDESENEVSKDSVEEAVGRNNIEDDEEDEDDNSEDQDTTENGNCLETFTGAEKRNSKDILSSDDNCDEDGEPVKSKRKRFRAYENIVSKKFKTSIRRRNEIIQKWNDKTQIASGKLNKNNFSAFQISTLKQIDHVLANKDRLLKRTQTRNPQPDVSKKIDENLEDTLDPECFNDDDFFHQLLRELIENSASNSNKSTDLSHHYLKLQKLRTKYKRKVDTKASKGRKIRYDIHPKLVNFMASYEDKNSMTENAKTELYKSIFKNLYDWKNELE